MAGGNFVHPLRFQTTWGCSGECLQHCDPVPFACTTPPRFVSTFSWFPQFGFATDRTTSSLPAVSCAHGSWGPLQECRLMLHSISSQQQRHSQPPLPPAAPGGQQPLPPPSTPAPASPKASSMRPPHPTVRVKPADLIEPVSDSASREHNRRRRSRHRDLHRRRSRSRSHRRRPLGRRARPILASDHRIAVPKPPPAVKAMPACRPSGLSYGR